MPVEDAIRVKAGDTISRICSRIYGVSPSQTRKHWNEFFRKDLRTGKFVAVADPNKIRAGETLYHRPDAAASESAPMSSARQDGLSIADGALLSADVYSSHGTLAKQKGWSRRDVRLWGSGFAAMCYERNGVRVVAYRGTDDRDDVLADLAMNPGFSGATGRTAMRQLLRRYRIRHGAIDQVASVLATLLSAVPAANAVPAAQTVQAFAYFDQVSPTPQYVVGHSLGGALAKAVGDHRAIPAIGYNSPFMGMMGGTIHQTSLLITNVNADGDPLSFMTRAIGNLSHGYDITVKIPELAPPARRSAAARGSRITGDWLVERLWNRAKTHLQNKIDELQADMEEVGDLVAYFLKAALHYHSIDNLRKAVGAMKKYQAPLG